MDHKKQSPIKYHAVLVTGITACYACLTAVFITIEGPPGPLEILTMVAVGVSFITFSIMWIHRNKQPITPKS